LNGEKGSVQPSATLFESRGDDLEIYGNRGSNADATSSHPL
jgi:hypothetical protein